MPSLNSLGAFAARRLTPERVRVYCLSVLAVNTLFLALQFVPGDGSHTRFGYALGGDFAAFYNAGTIYNNYGGARIYDLDLSDRLYHEMAPDEPPNASLPYAYAPFFVLPFALLARLPFPLAYLAWLLTSAALYLAGLLLAWEATESLPRDLRTTFLLLALAYVPFQMYCLTGGQVSTFSFFWIALAIFCEARRWPCASGLALSLLLFKPPLLLFFLPMLVVTGRLRALAGVLLGAGVLTLLSLLLVGGNGLLAYADLMLLYRHATSGPDLIFQIWKFVDAGSFLRLLLPGHPVAATNLKLAAVCAVVPPLLFLWWRARRSRAAWELALTWALVINLYVPIYDTILAVLSLLLTADLLFRNGLHLTIGFKLLLVLFFLVPWFTVHLALATGFQFFTLVIAALGVYQFSFVWRRGDRLHPDDAPGTDANPDFGSASTSSLSQRS